ncbi:helix-turn-helix domain-containing protein [Peteryoungia ipomoeae]|uniref:Helix-turn-helix domain-containing protein n=1 Tax=Peteryoungia ipomoeae TaxID=1210932 RepID=A0A4S8P1C1_9HYPH|nr:helix-turn-helix domain-containing protein [Peteryoungia ipomoeae]THV23091.1 helix-turn-helix domain-containing protein [Peteryoungia ipomoeae]
MDIATIRTLANDAEYRTALAAIRPYFESEPEEGTPEAAHFDALALLIEEYEDRNYPMPKAAPVDVIKAVMVAKHLTRDDLIEVLGSKSRASDLLNGRREINLDQIKKISRAWNIPVAALIGDLAA